MYRCDSWSIKLNTKEMMMRVPWTAKRSSKSILKEISPEYSMERLMLKLKLQYFGHLMWCQLIGKDPDAGKDLRAGGEEASRG